MFAEEYLCGPDVEQRAAGSTSQFTWETQGPDGTPLVLDDATNDDVSGPDGPPLEQVTGSTVS
jgi:hypothetical protein